MDIYGLPSKDRTAIIEERQLDSKKWLVVPGKRPLMHPTEADYIAAGWLLKVIPVLGVYERQGAVRIGLVQGEYTYFKDSWSQEEIAAHAAILEKQEIADLKQASPDALELLGKDNDWISDNIEALTAGSTNPEIVAGIREALKRQDRVSRDILNAVKAMVK